MLQLQKLQLFNIISHNNNNYEYIFLICFDE